MPAETSDETQEDGCGNRKGGLGLGEGEGEKDVSEEIENQVRSMVILSLYKNEE